MIKRTGISRRRSIPITSLIDVIFLLLLFFMLSSTFSGYSEIELKSAASTVEVADVPPIFLRWNKKSLSLNGEEVNLSELHRSLKPFILKGKKRHIIISLDTSISSQELVELLVYLRREEYFTIEVLE